jgi:hypothetical protein
MKKMKTRFLVALSFTVVAALWPEAARAIQDSEKALFGPIGVAGQAVRISAYAIGNPDTAPWEFTIRVFDPQGELVKETLVQAAPGTIGSAVFMPRDLARIPPDSHGRRTLRSEIVGFNPQPDPPGIWFTTLEVYGSSGVTTVYGPSPHILPNPER